MPRTVLVALDDSDEAQRALDYAVETFPGATLVLLNVVTGGPSEAQAHSDRDAFDDLRERRSEMLRAAMGDRDHDGPVETAVRIGNPAPEIVEYVEEEPIDQVVLGSHGREGVSRILLGSVAQEVVAEAPATVTVVR